MTTKSFVIFMAVELAAREISAKYDRFARWYDWPEGILDLLGLGSLRRVLLSRASGQVLEVAVGTGKNLAYYPSGCRITALDLSREMLKVGRNKAAKASYVSFLLADGKALPFPDKSFYAVVSSLSTCTGFPIPWLRLNSDTRGSNESTEFSHKRTVRGGCCYNYRLARI